MLLGEVNEGIKLKVVPTIGSLYLAFDTYNGKRHFVALKQFKGM